MKTTSINAHITVTPVPKIIALIIAMVDTVCYSGEREQILRTVAAHYGFRVVV